MANTFNLGNGSFAQKTEKLLAYNAENDNYKPLPFDFDRSTGATRVNRQGLIETVGTDKPRIDFLNNTKGHLLLEPFRRNIADYSEDGTEWDAIQATVSLDSSINKPDGIAGAYKVTDNTTNGQHRVDVRPTVVNGTQYTFSAFVKQAENSDVDFMYLLFTSAFTATRVRFNLSNGTAIGSNGTIENYGNGWYRVSATATADSDGAGIFGVNLINDDSGATYAGTGNGAMYVFGMQVEDAGSGIDAEYATSYIPTQGSAETRSAETCSGAGNSTVLNDSEGVLYGEIAALANDGTIRNISINNGSNSQKTQIGFTGANNRVSATIKTSSGTSDMIFDVASSLNFNKICVKYKDSDFALFVNGIKADTDTTINDTSSSLSEINFDRGDGLNDFYGKVKDLRVYNTALTDAELIALTS